MPMIGRMRRMRRRRVLAAGAVVGGTAYAAGKRGAEADQQDVGQEEVAEPQAPEAQAAPEPDFDELEKLAELHKEGVLTDEEFGTKKKQILGL